MKWQEFAKDYFSFTRKERIGVAALVFIILFVAFLPKIWDRQNMKQVAATDTAWISAAKKLEVLPEADERRPFNETSEKQRRDYPSDRGNTNPSRPFSMFSFDPNTIDALHWQMLGLKDKTIHIIQNYLNKGGHFYEAEDLKKIYSLPVDEYARLQPYIKIEGKGPDKKTVYSKEFEPKHSSYKAIDINTADTAAFISLPGIGAKLALRIVSFRDKLGGFYSINQIGEVYGLKDSVFETIKPYLKFEMVALRKININTATVDELKAHPYIRYNLADPIVSYRKEHGNFSKLDDLKKVMAVTDESYEKIIPYLTIQ